MKVLHSLREGGLIQLVRDGAVGVVPTDTVYGLAAAAHNSQAVVRLYELKHREHKPGTVIAANVEQLVDLGVKRRYLTAVERFWPNPLSVELPIGPDLAYLSQGTGHCAFRVVRDQTLQQLLAKTGPLLTSSANHPGKPPANNLEEAQAYFGEGVDFYVDGGDLSGRPPSTVIRVIDDAIEVVRQGAVTINENGEML